MEKNPDPLTLNDVVVEPPDDGVITDPNDWFGAPGPLELEIGCGKGGFLVRRAIDHPNTNLVGIEWANKFFKYAADRMVRRGLANVRIMRTDASHFVMHHLATACLSALHVYHPDPWPKKRHHKRRLFQPAFVSAAVRSLIPGGRLAVQTDHAEYFEHIEEVLRAHPDLSEIPFDDPAFGVQDAQILTNFEIKYTREGRDFHRLAFVKQDSGNL